MRMWMISPRHMCSKHIRGEHYELHLVSGAIAKNVNLNHIRALINNRMLDLSKLAERHDELAAELVRRGGNHKSDLWFEFDLLPESMNLSQVSVDASESLRELWCRCPDCRKLMQEDGISIDVTRNPGSVGPNGEYRKAA